MMTGKKITAALARRTMGFVLALLLAAPFVHAQAASRLLGTITTIGGDILTVKPAQGDGQQVEVPTTAQLKRIEPGQTNLSAAVAMQFSELAVGDRVLVNLDPAATPLVAMVPGLEREIRAFIPSVPKFHTMASIQPSPGTCIFPLARESHRLTVCCAPPPCRDTRD